MRPQLLHLLSLAAIAVAQDLVSVLQSQPDLSTLLELVVLANLTDVLTSATNITVVAPTNNAFAARAQSDDPEGVAIRYKNDSATVGALLRNHVFQGYYPSSAIGEVPTFAQTLVMPDEKNAIQPFTAMTGGQYNGLVLNGDNVEVLSAEFTVSTVTEADIKIGDGVIVHKIDTVMSFGAPVELFTARYGYTALNAALVQADLGVFAGIEIGGSDETPVKDITLFIPINSAFEDISSVLATANQSTLQDVLSYHLIQDNIIFSPSITNTTVATVQGGELAFTVTDEGDVFVNNAKVILPNVLLYEGVAHIIDSVLDPYADFQRSEVAAAAPVSQRVAFEGATSSSALPFTSVTFASETTFAASIDPIFSTAPAVNIALGSTIAADLATSTASATGAATSPATYSGAANARHASYAVQTGAALLVAAYFAVGMA